jgi:dihydroxyacid dehydratase/phosphogluconate dehydratase
VGFDIPLMVNLQPAGEYLGEDYYRAGGVPGVVNELLKAGKIRKNANTVNGKTLAANETEQLVVSAVREYRAAGLSLRIIGARLAARGMLPRKGGAWNPTQIKRIAEAA